MRSEPTDPSTHMNELENIVAPVCRAHGVELVSVAMQKGPGGGIVRLVIDREQPGADGSGVTLADCTNVSRDVSAALDVHEGAREGAIEGPYRLEVSSPGLDRPLVRPSDFEKFKGSEIRVQTRSLHQGRRRFVGRLVGVVGDRVELEQDGTHVPIPFAEIIKANLVYRFDSNEKSVGGGRQR